MTDTRGRNGIVVVGGRVDADLQLAWSVEGDAKSGWANVGMIVLDGPLNGRWCTYLLPLDPQVPGAAQQQSLILDGRGGRDADDLREELREGIFEAELADPNASGELRIGRLVRRLVAAEEETADAEAEYGPGAHFGHSEYRSGTWFVCGVCGEVGKNGMLCPECGAGGLARGKDGFIIEFPPGTLPCPGCGSVDEPVRLGGWVRLRSLLVVAWETRIGAYLCPDCIRTETTKSLAYTALLGWWSFPSWLFSGWRATYRNWRALWSPPRSPGDWGAISIEQMAYEIREHRHQYESAFEEELIAGSPLASLSQSQLELVLRSEGLYEVLGVEVDASREQINQAYRACARDAHPDRSRDPQATERMIRINLAREVLSSDDLRAAYDWLEAQRSLA